MPNSKILEAFELSESDSLRLQATIASLAVAVENFGPAMEARYDDTMAAIANLRLQISTRFPQPPQQALQPQIPLPPPSMLTQVPSVTLPLPHSPTPQPALHHPNISVYLSLPIRPHTLIHHHTSPTRQLCQCWSTLSHTTKIPATNPLFPNSFKLSRIVTPLPRKPHRSHRPPLSPQPFSLAPPGLASPTPQQPPSMVAAA
ncbi:hypothetical protein Salat_2661900 [Sesamum alatum]|uniref:Uncharacterized protein n=1 Tax=Sesamum alatum TaxID=300844 RepID=A0AAE1XPB7_9LAMI|nr:hypothetical protein Salat_2661900 [Sesamum alatum]